MDSKRRLHGREDCEINGSPALREPKESEIWAIRTQFEICSKLGLNAVSTLRQMGLNPMYKGNYVTHVWREDWAKPVMFDECGRYPERMIGVKSK